MWNQLDFLPKRLLIEVYRNIVPLIRLLAIEEPVSSSGAQDIRTAIREIARREQLTSESKVLKSRLNGEKAASEQILGKARNGNGKH